MSEEKEKRTLESLRRAARQLDSQPQLLTAAARLRTMLPGDDRYGDALSLSGREAHQLLGKSLAAVQPDRDSLVNEIGRIGLQLWQAAVASRRGITQGAEVTLLFTDLVGFSSWALDAGDASAVRLVREVGDDSDATIRAHGGRVVKHLGDGWMAVFPDAPSAVAAALDLHQRIGALEADGYRPRLRTGIHCGRPQALGGDYLGVDVNVTARVAEAARPGELLVSDVVAERIDGDSVAMGRARRLRAPGAPRELRVRPVQQAA
jgi:adenylate cyclase